MTKIWTKICGIRDVETAQAVAAVKADAIGLNFYERSPRVVSVEIAREIVRCLPRHVEPVGLFVNHPLDAVQTISGVCGLRTIQLHGDEPPQTIAALTAFRVIRAFRVGDAGLSEVTTYLAECLRLNALPWACLVDARVEGSYGGTGQVAPWDVLRREYNFRDWPPLILAGGLRPENVGEAIRTVQPWGVDVAGGVEATVACKDLAMVRKFVEEVGKNEDQK